MPTLKQLGRTPLALVLLVSLVPLAVFLVNPLQPLLEQYSFRQTQTALTAYWLMQGGEFLRYLTPVLGAPWTVPMEFPLYQWLVATICVYTGLPMDFAGRLLSLVFFYGACVPIILCLRRYGWPATIVAIVLFMTAPISLSFSRTFLIETLATTLALSALCSYVLYLRSGRPAYLWAFMAFGTLAGLQKITTFLPVAGVVGLDCIRVQARAILAFRWREMNILAPVCVALSLVLPIAWTLYSDQIKQEGALSQFVTSAALRDWNFGTLAQRLDIYAWFKIFAYRFTALGGLTVMAVLLLYAAFRKQLSLNREAALFLCCGLLGPLVFFNLHFVHEYYQVGSLVFLVCAASIAAAPRLHAMWQSGAGFVAFVLAVVVVNLSLFVWRSSARLVSLPQEEKVAHAIAIYLRAHEEAGDVTVAFGQDWSAVIPYYSQRYAIMVPGWVLPSIRAAIIQDVSVFADGRRIGAIIYCADDARPAEETAAERDQLFSQLDGPARDFEYCQIKLRG